jgi:DNA primase
VALDVRELKNYIYENNYVEQILENIECHHIKYHSSGGYWTCGNRDGDNKQAIVIRNNEFLYCENYTRKISNSNRATDIIDLVCYSLDITFPYALQTICNEIGVSYYHDFDEDIPESFKILKLLEEMDDNYDEENDRPLVQISDEILSYYKPYVNDLFYNDNIDYQTQKEFEIGYDEYTNRITIPIRSEIGDLVGVKGRLFKTELDEEDVKYTYVEPCARSKVIYGLYKTLKYIKNIGRIYIGESEKFVLQIWNYGYKNSGATGGKKLSQYQIEMLVRLGVDIVICFDKDVTKKELEELADRFPDGVPLFYMFDEDSLLQEKESPSDNPNNWKHMAENNIYKLR